ncbi:hypothetical protein CCMA1212_002000 [Trichoderma ghanense]|uniref:Uncharacterized protein n=1 Tax=Trichoderma ghanense TaxID=65468 RepID=A0ABY2HFU2_9HYPO
MDGRGKGTFNGVEWRALGGAPPAGLCLCLCLCLALSSPYLSEPEPIVVDVQRSKMEGEPGEQPKGKYLGLRGSVAAGASTFSSRLAAAVLIGLSTGAGGAAGWC